jgi:hypothetical protein
VRQIFWGVRGVHVVALSGGTLACVRIFVFVWCSFADRRQPLVPTSRERGAYALCHHKDVNVGMVDFTTTQ